MVSLTLAAAPAAELISPRPIAGARSASLCAGLRVRRARTGVSHEAADVMMPGQCEQTAALLQLTAEFLSAQDAGCRRQLAGLPTM